MDLLAFIMALKAQGMTAAQITAAVNEYLQDHPDALDQAAVEAILDGRLDVIDNELSSVKSAIQDLEAGSLSAVGATAGQVPVADGNGSWAWGNVSGGVNLTSVQTYVADYTNEPPTPTLGSVDKYYRRIYGV